MRVILIRSIS